MLAISSIRSMFNIQNWITQLRRLKWVIKLIMVSVLFRFSPDCFLRKYLAHWSNIINYSHTIPWLWSPQVELFYPIESWTFKRLNIRIQSVVSSLGVWTVDLPKLRTNHRGAVSIHISRLGTGSSTELSWAEGEKLTQFTWPDWLTDWLTDWLYCHYPATTHPNHINTIKYQPHQHLVTIQIEYQIGCHIYHTYIEYRIYLNSATTKLL